MKTYKIFTFALVFSMLSPLISLAQRDVYNWQISPYGGLLTLNNDIAVPTDANSYAYGLRIERRLGNDFTLGLHLSQLDLSGTDQNNLSGGFLSLGYHWDNGYLLSKRSAISIFHRLEVGYADRYSTIESINGTSADVAFGFENGFKFRFGDRISAEIALELLGSKKSLIQGDIAKNERYNVWKVGLAYHFGSRKSTYVAPVFVPYGGIPFGSKMSKVDRKDDNIWIANDSIYNNQLKEARFPKASDQSLATSPRLSRADSLLIFMHFDSLYQRRDLHHSALIKADTLAMDTLKLETIPDSIKANADSITTGELEKSLRDSSFSIMSVADSIGVNDSDTTSLGKTTIPKDSIVVVEGDTLSFQKAGTQVDSINVNKAMADTVVTNGKAKSLSKDSVKVKDSDKMLQRSDTSAQLKSVVVPATLVDSVYTEKSESINQKSDSTIKVVERKEDSMRNDTTMSKGDKVIPARVDSLNTQKQNRTEQKADSITTGAGQKSKSTRADTTMRIDESVIPNRVDTANIEKPDRTDQKSKGSTKEAEEKDKSSRVDTTMGRDEAVVPARVDTVYIEKPDRTDQKSNGSTKEVEQKDKLTRVDTSARRDELVNPTRTDTVYIEKSDRTDQKSGTSAKSKSEERNVESARVDTVYQVQKVIQEKPSQSDTNKNEEQEKDNSGKSNKTQSNTESSNQKSTDNNTDSYQKSLNQQNDLLADQNKQIIANQREIERLRKENRRDNTGKVIAAGAAGTALGAVASGGNNNQDPDTVYYESAAAQQKLDSLALELAALKKQYGITDSIPEVSNAILNIGDTAYVPDPPIGMYFQNDSTGADSVSSASESSTMLSTSDSLKIVEDSLRIAINKADGLSKDAEVSGEAAKDSDKNNNDTEFTSEDSKASSQMSSENAAPALLGKYPVECNFGLNKTLLDADELTKLDPVITDLKNDETLKVFLTGYTDNSGNADYNMQLSKKRAKSVMDYLTAGGVAADRIEVRGSGVLESSDKFSLNARRVDVTIGEY